MLPHWGCGVRRWLIVLLTLGNLRFILEHEQLEDEELATHWVLNQLADGQVAHQFRELLTEFGAHFTELSLELDMYAQAPFHVVVEDHGVDEVHSEQLGEDQWTKNQNVNAVYGSKNRYALAINVARNFMLDIARKSGARWLLPWDQTCFLTREAWTQIKRDLDAAAPDQKYFVSFMDRLTEENDVIFSRDFKANPWEEPQIIFRNDSVERFDEQLRYGQRDKAALLVRLRVPGVWDGWGWSTWEQRRTSANMSEDVTGPESVPKTGYVLRLYSGLDLLDKLEERVVRNVFAYHSDKLLIYDEALIQKCKNEAATERGKQAIAALLNDANRALQVTNPWTVRLMTVG
uniref:Uncharacterized protein n=1 Tax=Phytophthora ramorum TaxID=164328 RepID=H3HEG6_PHYRM